MIVQEIGKIKYKFAIKSNTGGVGNITYEFLKFSGATTMEGKVPKDLLQELLKSYGRDFRMPLHTDYENKSFDSGNWKTKLNLIKLQLKCPIGDEIENFLDILESTWVDHNKPTDINYAIIQIIDFLFILAQIQHLGTPGYCAPEIYMSKPYGVECDMVRSHQHTMLVSPCAHNTHKQWSFGCIQDPSTPKRFFCG